jgi:hypothetical protein
MYLTATYVFLIMICGFCSVCKMYKDCVVAQVVSCWHHILEVLSIPKSVPVWILVGRMVLGRVSLQVLYFNFLQYHSTMLNCHSVVCHWRYKILVFSVTYTVMYEKKCENCNHYLLYLSVCIGRCKYMCMPTRFNIITKCIPLWSISAKGCWYSRIFT